MNKIKLVWVFSFLLGCQPSNSTNEVKVNNGSINKDSFMIDTEKKEEKMSSLIDSTEDVESIILERVRQTYEWYFTSDNLQDFPVTGNDTMFTAIDWQKMEQRITQLRQTGFFADEFLESYREIAETIDHKLKTNEVEYYLGYYPPYGNGANPWCNCQDSPDKFWQDMQLKNLKINGDKASAIWTFANTDWDHGYNIRLSRESGTWQISHLQEFDVDKFFF
jgi:hypothetical protein